MRLLRAGLAGVALLTLVGCTDIPPAAATSAAAVVEVPAQNSTPYWAWETTYAHKLQFLVCTRHHETPSAPDGGYTYPEYAGHPYSGAYQWLRRTWANATTAAGYPYLAMAGPWTIPAKYQDLAAIALVRTAGAAPWGGRCSWLIYRQANGLWAFR